jgi:hypothetical protein
MVTAGAFEFCTAKMARPIAIKKIIQKKICIIFPPLILKKAMKTTFRLWMEISELLQK